MLTDNWLTWLGHRSIHIDWRGGDAGALRVFGRIRVARKPNQRSCMDSSRKKGGLRIAHMVFGIVVKWKWPSLKRGCNDAIAIQTAPVATSLSSSDRERDGMEHWHVPNDDIIDQQCFVFACRLCVCVFWYKVRVCFIIQGAETVVT